MQYQIWYILCEKECFELLLANYFKNGFLVGDRYVG